MKTIEKDELFLLAEKYINETGVSLFLTGKAGTGKTTFLKYIEENTQKRCVVLAPTGVAAINAGGSTIHSFFQLPLCPYLPDVKELLTEYQMPQQGMHLRKDRLRLIRSLDLLIIDEISMVRADLLDAIDMSLRRIRHSGLPFGGVQLLMIGDAQQLSPVVTQQERPYIEQVYPSPYFFESKALKKIPYVVLQLEHIYRQQDPVFVDLLNRIRNGHLTAADRELLNSRLDPSFQPPKKENWIRLTTHNQQADRVNQAQLDALKGRSFKFLAEIEGTFPQSAYPAPSEIGLKKGEQVMFIRNDASGMNRFYNGKIGTIRGFDPYAESVIVEDENGGLIEVKTETWENIRYELDSESGEIKQQVEGTFTQIPLRPAWAVTIHKSQGLTFDRVIIDAADAFAFGQVYVALSRCRSLEGIVLSSPITASCLKEDKDVEAFSQCYSTKSQLEEHLEGFQKDYFLSQALECFRFDFLSRQLAAMERLFQEHLSKRYAGQTAKTAEAARLGEEMKDVGNRFGNQLRRLCLSDSLEALQNGTGDTDGRVRKAADYFLTQLCSLTNDIVPLMDVDIDNAAVKKPYNEICHDLLEEVRLKISCMELICQEGFNPRSYQETKLQLVLGKRATKAAVKKKSARIKSTGKAAKKR